MRRNEYRYPAEAAGRLMIDSVAVMRDVSGRICVLLFSDGKAFSLAPLSDQLAEDLRSGLGRMLDGESTATCEKRQDCP